jgi:hypothetical protein
MVNGGSNDILSGVTVSGHSAGKVDPMHKPSAEQSAQGISIVGQNDFCHF